MIENSLAEFAKSFGITKEELPPLTCLSIIENNFAMEEIVGKERDSLVISILEKILNDNQQISAPERTIQWESGWNENLRTYLASGGKFESLTPKFIRPAKAIRWGGKYYKPKDSYFELNYIKVLRTYLYEKYITGSSSIYEFGAGTGFNLLHFHQLDKKLRLVGTDFVESSVQLIGQLAKDNLMPMKSSIFDMLNPELFNLEINADATVVTFGSIEQLGGKFQKFISYLIKQKPRIVIHVEPDSDLYSVNTLEDYLAKWFQEKRGYSKGLNKHLKDLSDLGDIRIERVHRLNFGSQMMEGFNLFVWSPA